MSTFLSVYLTINLTFVALWALWDPGAISHDPFHVGGGGVQTELDLDNGGLADGQTVELEVILG